MENVQSKVEELSNERDELLSKMQQLQSAYDNMKTRVIEINGSIKTLVEMFKLGENQDDTENKTNTGSDSNKE